MNWNLKTLEAMRLALVQESGFIDDKAAVIKKAEQKMTDYLLENGLQFEGQQKYFAEINVASGGKEGLVYVIYVQVGESLKKSGGIDIIKLKESDYAYTQIPEENANEELKEKLPESLSVWLKENGLKEDMSNIFYLMETIDGKRCVYIPVRR